MPLYEFQCEFCGAGVELSRPVAERNNPVQCPECDPGMLMVRVPSLTSFALKGGGWTPKGSFVPSVPRPRKRTKGYDMTGTVGRDEE
jgi:putative FmdB family regulatory protein